VIKQAKHSLIDPEFAEQRAGVLRALGNPVRLRIIACLAGDSELCVGRLCDLLGLPQSSISRQLGWLRLNELVSVRSDGGFRYYTLAIPQLVNLLQCLENCGSGIKATDSTDMKKEN
jgi:DNA-binding transcriptional ArsR family regulator